MLTGDRIKEVRNEKRLTQKQLAKLSGVAQSTIGDLERGRNQGSSKIASIAKVLGVNAMWLAEGKGEKYVSTSQELHNFIESNIQPIVTDSVELPLMNAKPSMGDGNDAPEHELVIDVLRVSKSWINKTVSPITGIQNLAFIHAIGDSMHPTFNDGDILLVDTGNKSLTADKIYVIEAYQRLFIKRIRQRYNDGKYEISSDNPLVKTVDTLNGDHEVTVKGRVVFVWNGKKV